MPVRSAGILASSRREGSPGTCAFGDASETVAQGVVRRLPGPPHFELARHHLLTHADLPLAACE